MSNPNDLIRGIGINLYKNQWVLTSSEQIEGGQTLDATPVRLIEHHDRQKLASMLRELFGEKVPTIGQPDWNDPEFKVGIRATALGLKSWRAFVKDSRCFNLERYASELILEEWPKEGGSFTANFAWRKKFPVNAIEQVAEYLIRKTRDPKVVRPQLLRRSTTSSRRKGRRAPK